MDALRKMTTPSLALPDAMLNPATWATTEDLIGLRRQAGEIDLSRARSARASLMGNHLSRFRGRGMDYQESRSYQAGDDVRTMDWRVTARTGKPHVKLYQEERERPIVLFLDLNPGISAADPPQRKLSDRRGDRGSVAREDPFGYGGAADHCGECPAGSQGPHRA